MKLELVSVPTDYGRGANDGSYYPPGLLSIATHVKRNVQNVDVRVIDLHHRDDYVPVADVVGISAPSTLNYRNVIEVAKRAKETGAVVVLGGAHATSLAEQIMTNQSETVDMVVRGRGEQAVLEVVNAMADGSSMGKIHGLSWRKENGETVHNESDNAQWHYDDYLPLDFNLLDSGLKPYHDSFRKRLNKSIDASFIIFTHFGCEYRKRMSKTSGNGRISKWCSYCSICDSLLVRNAEQIVKEAEYCIQRGGVEEGSTVLLKCYGDNIISHVELIENLGRDQRQSEVLKKYNILWNFYARSTNAKLPTYKKLKDIGTKYIFVGFESADDELQRHNALGTTLHTHECTIANCLEVGIQLQAGFVLGCAKESEQTLEKTLRFADRMRKTGVLERINTAVIVIIPGSPAYDLLCEREPWIRKLDVLPTEELQLLWIKHFCPKLGRSPEHGMELLLKAVNQLDDMSPGPHSSMGYTSKRLKAELASEERKWTGACKHC